MKEEVEEGEDEPDILEDKLLLGSDNPVSEARPQLRGDTQG